MEGDSLFENLRLESIYALCDVVGSSIEGSTRELKRQFTDRAQNFEQTVAFLEAIKAIRRTNQKIDFARGFETTDRARCRQNVLNWLFRSNNRYRNEVRQYLSKFEVFNGTVRYTPLSSQLSRESAIRNFLIEMKVIVRIQDTNEYQIEPSYFSLYVDARNNRKFMSPTTLDREQRKKSTIGKAAELAILDFERARLGSKYRNRVKHISVRNQAAGYDIESISIDPVANVTPRLIEVKAVSYPSYRFNWSDAEIQVARELTFWYWLYLLPVGKNGEFDLPRLIQLRNPNNELLREKSRWAIRSDGLVCQFRDDALDEVTTSNRV